MYQPNDYGQLVGFKARIVYPGNRLTSGIHYDPKETATYSADRDSLRFVISRAAQDDHEIYHADVKSAFLHEFFKGKTPLYLQALPTFDGDLLNPDMVYMLTANLYGTPQACRVYIDGAYAHLKRHGYRQCVSDHNVFTKDTDAGQLTMALTIDDVLVAAPSHDAYKDLLKALSLKYRVKDLGPATRILNWTIVRPKKGKRTYHLSQPHKAQQFIDLMGMDRSNPAKTPQTKGHLIHAKEAHEALLSTNYPYAAALGVLRYLADCTRPDVAFITGALARHTKAPTLRHWRALQYVARYIKGTKTHGIYYGGTKEQLQAFADSDFADCTDTRQSTHGNLLYYAGSPISWCSRRIKTVVTSTCAAEYISNSKTGEHIAWLRSLLTETRAKPTGPTPLYNDNTAAEDVAHSRGQTRRSKYIDIRWHHVKNLISRGLLKIVHIASADLVADALTKCLYAPTFLKHKKRMNLVPPDLS